MYPYWKDALLFTSKAYMYMTIEYIYIYILYTSNANVTVPPYRGCITLFTRYIVDVFFLALGKGSRNNIKSVTVPIVGKLGGGGNDSLHIPNSLFKALRSSKNSQSSLLTTKKHIFLHKKYMKCVSCCRKYLHTPMKKGYIRKKSPMAVTMWKGGQDWGL